MAYKSPTEINWSKGAGESLNYVNEVTNAVFSNMLLFSLYIIVLFGAYKSSKDFISALAISGITTTLIGLIMWIGGWVTWPTFAVCVGLAVVGVAALLIDNK